MIKSFRHVGINVKDLTKAIHFYQKTLGLKKVVKLLEGDSYFNRLINTKNLKAEVLKLKSDDGIIVEIIRYIGSGKKAQINKIVNTGTMHMCFTVNNISKIYKKLKRSKYKTFSPPLKSPYDPVSTFFCYDPDYNIVQFVEGKQIK